MLKRFRSPDINTYYIIDLLLTSNHECNLKHPLMNHLTPNVEQSGTHLQTFFIFYYC